MNGLSAVIGSALLTFLLILQSSIISRIPLLQGSPDLVLLAVVAWASQKRVETGWLWGIIGGLLVGYVSAVQLPVYLMGYLAAAGLATALRQRMWNVPQLIMLISVIGGTLFVQGLTWVSLRFSENPTSIVESLNLIILPSLLLNLLLAMPFFLVIGDLARLLYPQPLEN
jgi:rod shape-determining protein MreD